MVKKTVVNITIVLLTTIITAGMVIAATGLVL